MKTIYKIISVLLVFMLWIPLISQEKNLKKLDEPAFIEWKKIQGANGYQMEIRDSAKKVTISKKMNENIFFVDDTTLKGKYEVRVSPLNTFEKPVVWSLWKPVQVIVSHVPEITSDAMEIQKSNSNQKISISGEYFLENTKIKILSKDGKQMPVTGHSIDKDRNLVMDLDLKNTKPGKYDLTLENPLGKKLTKKEFITVLEPKPKENVAKKVEPVFKKEEPTKNLEETIVVSTSKKEAPKLEPKIEREKSKEVSELDSIPDDYESLEKSTLDGMLGRLKTSCKTSDLPDALIDKCYENHVLLRLKTKKEKDLYSYLRLKSPNYIGRINSYEYFIKNCKMKSVRGTIEEKKDSYFDETEANYMKRTLASIDNCSNN